MDTREPGSLSDQDSAPRRQGAVGDAPGARGERLIFGSLYAPTERSTDAAKDKDKEKEKFWSDVMAALEEIEGLKERD
jgi:hypothetical protein